MARKPKPQFFKYVDKPENVGEAELSQARPVYIDGLPGMDNVDLSDYTVWYRDEEGDPHYLSLGYMAKLIGTLTDEGMNPDITALLKTLPGWSETGSGQLSVADGELSWQIAS